MNNPVKFYASSGGGQYFAHVGNTLHVVCEYLFNPCVEAMKFTPDILTSLRCVESTEEAYRTAQLRVMKMLGVAGPLTELPEVKPYVPVISELEEA